MKKYLKIFCALFFMIFSTSLFSSDWYICLGSFKDKLNAQNREKILNDNSIPSFVIQHTSRKGEKLFRVLLDEPIKTEKKAEARKIELEKTLSKKGIKINGIWYYQPYASSLKRRVEPLKSVGTTKPGAAKPTVTPEPEKKPAEEKKETEEETYAPIVIPQNDPEEPLDVIDSKVAENTVVKPEDPAEAKENPELSNQIINEETKEAVQSEDEAVDIAEEIEETESAGESDIVVIEPAEETETESTETATEENTDATEESETTEPENAESAEVTEPVEPENTAADETEDAETASETEPAATETENAKIVENPETVETESPSAETETPEEPSVEVETPSEEETELPSEEESGKTADDSSVVKEENSNSKDPKEEAQDSKDIKNKDNPIPETSSEEPGIDVPAKDPYKEKIEDLIEVYGTAEI